MRTKDRNCIESRQQQGSIVWLASELYYPEQTSTGHFLTEIAEGLAETYSVSVLCSQPTYSDRGQRAPRVESRQGVTIHRCWSTTFDKNLLPLRLINSFTFTLSTFVIALRQFRRDDVVLVVTNPPTLPSAIAAASWLRRVKWALIVHDVYPEVLVATGMLRSNAVVTTVLRWLTKQWYWGARRIVALGRDMAALIQARLCRNSDKVTIIEHWPDLDVVQPLYRGGNEILQDLGISDRFVVQYLGNMGRTHGLDTVLDCASALQDCDDVHFLFIGTGAARAQVEQKAKHLGLDNVTFQGRVPYSRLSLSLAACDVAIISSIGGMKGISVPSRMYNVMAAARPIIAVVDKHSELAQVVVEENIGWVISPGDLDTLRQVILEAKADRPLLQEMGNRARRTVLQKYTRRRAIQAYTDLVASMFADKAND